VEAALKVPMAARTAASYGQVTVPVQIIRPLTRCAWLVVCYVIAQILKGTNMRGILGLVVTVVVIVIVLRFLGVI